MSGQNRTMGNQKLKEKFSTTKILCEHYNLSYFTIPKFIPCDEGYWHSLNKEEAPHSLMKSGGIGYKLSRFRVTFTMFPNSKFFYF